MKSSIETEKLNLEDPLFGWIAIYLAGNVSVSISAQIDKELSCGFRLSTTILLGIPVLEAPPPPPFVQSKLKNKFEDILVEIEKIKIREEI